MQERMMMDTTPLRSDRTGLETRVLTQERPSAYSRHSYEYIGFRLRTAFENALAVKDHDEAERVIRGMRGATGDVLWCANAERRLYYRRQRCR